MNISYFRILTLFLIQICNFVLSSNVPKALEVVHEWRDLEYTFPSDRDRQIALNMGLYVPGNGYPIDVDVDYQPTGTCRVFTTIPRFATGVPFSLATISKTRGPNGPLLVPYPSYNWHSSHGLNCEGITSAIRTMVDPCKRIWVLDTGRIDTTQYCPPQLLVFDLRTDMLVHRHRFTTPSYKPGVSLLITPVLDVRDPPPTGRCSNVKVYIADVQGYGLVVYDSLTDSSWRVQNKLMYANPEYGTHTIAGESFDLMDGIFSLALTPQTFPGERYLYFHSLAGVTENAVQLSLIDNRTIWQMNVNAIPRAFKEIGNRNIQATAEAIDSRGNIYFGIEDPPAIKRWSINTRYEPRNINSVSENVNTLQFASGMKVVRNNKGKEELWTLTNRLQKISAGTKNTNEINFRIQGCAIDELLSDTGSCGSSRNYIGNNYIYP